MEDVLLFANSSLVSLCCFCSFCTFQHTAGVLDGFVVSGVWIIKWGPNYLGFAHFPWPFVKIEHEEKSVQKISSENLSSCLCMHSPWSYGFSFAPPWRSIQDSFVLFGQPDSINCSANANDQAHQNSWFWCLESRYSCKCRWLHGIFNLLCKNDDHFPDQFTWPIWINEKVSSNDIHLNSLPWLLRWKIESLIQKDKFDARLHWQNIHIFHPSKAKTEILCDISVILCNNLCIAEN